MNRVLLGVALAALSFPLTAALSPVHADDDSISYDNTNYTTDTAPPPAPMTRRTPTVGRAATA